MPLFAYKARNARGESIEGRLEAATADDRKPNLETLTDDGVNPIVANGFAFGEHGLIDKRTAYEESMRVPMLGRFPGVKGGTVVEQVVANIDIAPTGTSLELRPVTAMAAANRGLTVQVGASSTAKTSPKPMQ